MDYTKKLIVLKQTENSFNNRLPLTALARIEIENGVGEFHFSIVNFVREPNAKYYVLLVDSLGKHFEFELKDNATTIYSHFLTLPDLEKGVALGFYSVNNFLPLTLAFGSEKGATSLESFKKIIAEKCLVLHKEQSKTPKNEQFSAKKEKQQSCDNFNESDDFLGCEKNTQFNDKRCNENTCQNTSQAVYNDEVVATSDYYLLDEQIQQKLKALRDYENEKLPYEDELSYSQNEQETEKEPSLFSAYENETSASMRKENLEEFLKDETQENYLDKVKSQLDNLFLTNPEEQDLQNLFLGSKWAKIYYTQEKFYVVGLITLQKDKKYICYGVPSIYSKEPPKALKGYATFVPKSVFDMHGEGYWLMFQDTLTGKCVFPT